MVCELHLNKATIYIYIYIYVYIYMYTYIQPQGKKAFKGKYLEVKMSIDAKMSSFYCSK